MSKKSSSSSAETLEVFWSLTNEQVYEALKASPQGLTETEAHKRLDLYGPNVLVSQKKHSVLPMFFSQFKNPLVIVLIFAGVISMVVKEWMDALIIFIILFISAILSFIQEYSASHAIEELMSKTSIKCTVIRDGKPVVIPNTQVVVGDVVLLSAGSLIPADGLLIETTDFFVNQAVLTGESYPSEKNTDRCAPDAEVAKRDNVVYMGTNVRSGSAKAIIVQTGKRTEFGQIAHQLQAPMVQTDFELGIQKFGMMLSQIILMLVLAVFFINILRQQPLIESLLFAIALAVGIAPELLPAILNVNLSKGAQKMADIGVIVRRLNAIENLGSMDVLCTDKTGTITQGVIQLDQVYDAQGNFSQSVLDAALLNAYFQTGITNPMDEAILKKVPDFKTDWVKLAEIPYDFSRKRLSVVVSKPQSDAITLITKGALLNVLEICSSIQIDDRIEAFDASHQQALDKLYENWSRQGYRILALATQEVKPSEHYTIDTHEKDLVFRGFLLFFDPLKEDIKDVIDKLHQTGVNVKIITGDNRWVAQHVAENLGMDIEAICPSPLLKNLTDDGLGALIDKTAIFAEMDPIQKERVVRLLRKRGHVVGYMGDGINDAPSLHSADVGISVDNAVDVAKEAADFVLLKQDLDVLLAGVMEGRRTFANTLKYIYTTISANFGNMISMAGASLFLPFLPMVAKQILLNNLLSDIPAIGTPSDRVDPEMVDKPHRWDIRNIRTFMITFGLVSSFFDYATFGVLLWLFKSSEVQFQTAWFVESLLTELVIALVVRTRKLCFKSRPGRLLWALTVIIGSITLMLPYLPGTSILGLTPLPLPLLLSLIFLTLAYVVAVEGVKKRFFRHHAY